MQIRELMTTNVTTCTPESTLTQVAQLMKQENVGSIPVVQGDRLMGIITDRDIVVKCIADGSSCDQVKADAAMTTNPVTCAPDTDAHEAARLMAREQIRRLPVVDGGRLVGICALGDLAVVDIHVNEAGEALSGISEQHQVH